MLFILNKNYEVVESLNDRGNMAVITPYFDDEYLQYLATGAETFTFSTLGDSIQSQHIVVGNFIAFRHKNEYKLFNIINVDEEHTDTFIKNVYCEMASIELINDIVRPMKFSGTVKNFINNILSETSWQLGKLDMSLIDVIDLDLKDYKSVYSLLQEHIVESFGAEISYRVKIEHNKIVGKYIDVYAQRGKDRGLRFAYTKNLTSIKRTIDTSNIVTALIGIGNSNITFKDLDLPDKPAGQDFIVSESAYRLWNANGHHIMGTHKVDTDSPQELLKLTRKALEERSVPQTKYEMKVELLGEEVEIGDTVKIVDHGFNPPIYLEGRVNQLKVSYTDPTKNECVLANFKEIGTNISAELKELAGYVDSKFPINGSTDIIEGTVGKEQISKTYTTEIIADAVYASLLETEELIANKASIEDLKATNAQIENLKAKDAEIQNAIIENADITFAQINQLKADVGEIDTLLAGNLTSENIQAGSITSNELATGTITAGSGIIAEGAIGSAEISNIDAGKISAGKIDTSKVEVAGTNNHLRLKGNRIQVFQGIGTSAVERVSMGDVNGDGSIYGLRVRGADGQTILLDENGVTNEGLTNGSITNEKISDDANIDGAKLNINSVVSKINEDGTETIQGTKIEVDGTTLNTKLSTITNKQTEDSERITQAQSQISANTNAIKLKVDSQTYQTDKTNMTTQMNKNTSEISAMKGEIALKVEQVDIEKAVSEIEGVIDTKVESAKSEMKITTDTISQNVSNLETTTTSIGKKADSALTQANTNKGNITTLQGTVNTTNSKVATLETNLKGITSKVSSAETNIEKIGNASSQNLLYNSDFRIMKGSLPDEWIVADNTQITLDTNSTLLDGIPSFGFNVTGLTVNAWKAVYSPFIDAKAGEKFVASVYVKGHNDWSTLDAGGGLQIEYFNDSSRLGTSGANINRSILDWQRLVAKGTAPAGTTRVRIRVHPSRNGRFYMSKPMLQYGETVTGWDRGFDIKNLTTRLATAESKITEDAITNTVKKNFYTKSEAEGAITSKGYQTASQVQQTVNGLQVKVQESGGYNLIYNGDFRRNDTSWTVSNRDKITFSQSGLSCPNGRGIKMDGALKTSTSVFQYVSNVGQISESITVSYYTYVSSSGEDGTTNAYRAGELTLGYTDGTNTWHSLGNVSKFDTWEKISITVKPTKRVNSIRIGLYNRDTTKVVYYSAVMIEKGALVNEWTPNPNEVYDGVTTIDKDGITVSNTSSSTHTQIDSESFRVENSTGGTVAEFSQNSRIPNLSAGIITANEIYAGNICSKSPKAGDIKFIYVNGSTGNDNNAGTQASPYKTVQRAIDDIKDKQDQSVTIYVYNSVQGFELKGVTGTGVITFSLQDSAVINGYVILGGVTNSIRITNESGSLKSTFKNGISIYRCVNVDIYGVTFRGVNAQGNNIYIQDTNYCAVNSCDLGGMNSSINHAIGTQASKLWFYNCQGSNMTYPVLMRAFSQVYLPRAGTSKVPDYTGVTIVANGDGGERVYSSAGGTFTKTPSSGWNPAYTPTQKTQTWSFNKIWSDETLNGWSDRQELIQGYASTWNTGRWTGYMQFTDSMSAIRSAISGGTNFSGRLYVQRRTSSGNSTGSKLCLYASDGTLITNSTTINRGQGVWVTLSSAIISKIASGAITYFYLKADANNTSTFFKCEANPKIEITYTK